ncbi:DNA transfer protein [Tatumella sp. TA1]|nr:DNA transfer protein [Tatumella sp. TA1]
MLLSGYQTGLHKGGAGKAASAQSDATNRGIDLQRDQWQTVMNNLKPYSAVGIPALQQLQGLSSLQGQNDALNGFYGSSQFSNLANQARYQQLASAEATGGLGSTANSNGLAALVPQLGQNWLSNQMQNQSNLLSIGMNAAAGQASAGQNYANNTQQLLQQNANASAAAANQPSRLGGAVMGAASGAASGAMIGSVVPGIGTAVGAVGGGIIGGLGSLVY